MLTMQTPGAEQLRLVQIVLATTNVK